MCIYVNSDLTITVITGCMWRQLIINMWFWKLLREFLHSRHFYDELRLNSSLLKYLYVRATAQFHWPILHSFVYIQKFFNWEISLLYLPPDKNKSLGKTNMSLCKSNYEPICDHLNTIIPYSISLEIAQKALIFVKDAINRKLIASFFLCCALRL